MKYISHNISFCRYFLYIESNGDTICFTRWDKDYGHGIEWEVWYKHDVLFTQSEIEEIFQEAENKRLK